MTYSRRAVLHLAEGTPDHGAADMTTSRSWMSEFLERTEEETETTVR